jgi:hypothetical protein
MGRSVGTMRFGISASRRWPVLSESPLFVYCRCGHSLFTHGREIAIAVFLTALVCEGITSLLFYSYIEKESTIITTQREDLKKVPFRGQCRHYFIPQCLSIPPVPSSSLFTAHCSLLTPHSSSHAIFASACSSSLAPSSCPAAALLAAISHISTMPSPSNHCDLAHRDAISLSISVP